jgi:DNA-binding transcriptional ArsR family regulator
VAPYLPIINRRITQARDSHCRQLFSGGTEALLSSLTPFRWRYPILEADFPHDFDLHLDGRGLLLIPAFFCVCYPVKLFDPDLPPTLVFPVSHDPTWLARDSAGDRAGSLAQLIGASRANILELIGGSPAITAATIVEQLHLSAPAVSYHTKILRESGLLDSDWDGPSVIHHVTPLGIALLCNAPPPV